MHNYLAVSPYIDWQHPTILAQAQQLSANHKHPATIAQACFEFVCDQIKHSWDYRLNPVTCKASDVLHYGTGYCYAKSHLLAALYDSLISSSITKTASLPQFLISNNQKPDFLDKQEDQNKKWKAFLIYFNLFLQFFIAFPLFIFIISILIILASKVIQNNEYPLIRAFTLIMTTLAVFSLGEVTYKYFIFIYYEFKKLNSKNNEQSSNICQNSQENL